MMHKIIANSNSNPPPPDAAIMIIKVVLSFSVPVPFVGMFEVSGVSMTDKDDMCWNVVVLTTGIVASVTVKSDEEV